MTADLNQFPQLDKTKFEQRGIQLEIGVPVTCAVSIGNNIAAGFGDGTIRVFSSKEALEGGVVRAMQEPDELLTEARNISKEIIKL